MVGEEGIGFYLHHWRSYILSEIFNYEVMSQRSCFEEVAIVPSEYVLVLMVQVQMYVQRQDIAMATNHMTGEDQCGSLDLSKFKLELSDITVVTKGRICCTCLGYHW